MQRVWKRLLREMEREVEKQMVQSCMRGHVIYYDGSVADDSRPCKKCGNMPNDDGSDYCLGHIPGAKAACCGHGVQSPYVLPNEGGEKC